MKDRGLGGLSLIIYWLMPKYLRVFPVILYHGWHSVTRHHLSIAGEDLLKCLFAFSLSGVLHPLPLIS